MSTDYRKYILSAGTHYISNSDENVKVLEASLKITVERDE